MKYVTPSGSIIEQREEEAIYRGTRDGMYVFQTPSGTIKAPIDDFILVDGMELKIGMKITVRYTLIDLE